MSWQLQTSIGGFVGKFATISVPAKYMLVHGQLLHTVMQNTIPTRDIIPMHSVMYTPFELE